MGTKIKDLMAVRWRKTVGSFTVKQHSSDIEITLKAYMMKGANGALIQAVWWIQW